MVAKQVSKSVGKSSRAAHASKTPARSSKPTRKESDLHTYQNGDKLWTYRDGGMGVGLPPDFNLYIRAYREMAQLPDRLNPGSIVREVRGRTLVIEHSRFQLAVVFKEGKVQLWLKEGKEPAVQLEEYE